MRILFNLSILLMLSLNSCKKVNLEPIKTKVNPNLEYFGFTLIDVYWDDPKDKSDKINYLDEVSSFSNLADILVIEPSDNIIDRVKDFDDNQVKAVLHLNEIFFEQTSIGGNKSGVIYGLRSDYKSRWDEFISVNSINSMTNKIACLYIGEEPAWNSISESEFQEATDYAKSTAPNIPILNVEAYASIDEIYCPNSVDWVGFDHYFIQNPSFDPTFQNEYAIMKSKMKNHQNILLVMDTHWMKNFHGSVGIAKNDMDCIARDYYNMANNDTSVVGILGYFWPSGFDFKNSVGARHMPKHVLEEYKLIGKTITGK
ncbi:hypothetical protein [Crocinitomix algicola]|uniref:hypothetical protein n=1 Tax=Crocinitomix algicola TaxID=1740263 RepID=UPI001112D109|nr:hypothetical protein [Crocinitomix algicola]